MSCCMWDIVSVPDLTSLMSLAPVDLTQSQRICSVGGVCTFDLPQRNTLNSVEAVGAHVLVQRRSQLLLRLQKHGLQVLGLSIPQPSLLSNPNIFGVGCIDRYGPALPISCDGSAAGLMRPYLPSRLLVRSCEELFLLPVFSPAFGEIRMASEDWIKLGFVADVSGPQSVVAGSHAMLDESFSDHFVLPRLDSGGGDRDPMLLDTLIFRHRGPMLLDTLIFRSDQQQKKVDVVIQKEPTVLDCCRRCKKEEEEDY